MSVPTLLASSESGIMPHEGPLIPEASHHKFRRRAPQDNVCRVENVIFRSQNPYLDVVVDQEVAFDLPQYYEMKHSIAKGTFGFVARGVDLSMTVPSLPAAASAPDVVPIIQRGASMIVDDIPGANSSFGGAANAFLLAGGDGGAGATATNSADAAASGGDAAASDGVAIKKIPSVFVDTRFWICAIRELTLMHFVNHKNVMGLRNFYIGVTDPTPGGLRQSKRSFETLYCVMDCMNMSLRSYLTCNPDVACVPLPPRLREYFPADVTTVRPLNLDQRKYLLFQIICGLEYLHRCTIVHRDLKPENILMTTEMEVKICDLGQGRGILTGSIASTERMTCTLLYAAPETLVVGQTEASSSNFSLDQLRAGDVWAVGCIWAEMVLGTRLFEVEGAQIAVLKTMFSVLGRPTVSELRQLTDHMTANEKRTVDQIIERGNYSTASALPSMLRAADPTIAEAEISVITSMLCWDPLARVALHAVLVGDIFCEWFSEDDIGEPQPYQYKTKTEMEQPEFARSLLWELFLTHHPELRNVLDGSTTPSPQSTEGMVAAAST